MIHIFKVIQNEWKPNDIPYAIKWKKKLEKKFSQNHEQKKKTVWHMRIV